MTRRLLALAALVAVTFGWFDPAVAAEAPTFPGDPPFERLLATGPPGFRLDDSLAGPDLRFDVLEFRAVTSSQIPEKAFDEGALYGVVWRHPNGERVIALQALSARTSAAASAFVESSINRIEVDGSWDRTTVDGASVSYVPAGELVVVTAILGTRAVLLFGPDDGQDETIAFARSFVEQMQQLPPRPDVVTENETVAYRAGRVVGMVLTLALVVGGIVWVVRRSRRPAAAPVPGPGWYGPPGSPPPGGPPTGWPPQSGPPPGWSPPQPGPPPGWAPQSGPPPGWAPQPGPPAPPPSNLPPPPPPSNLPPPPPSPS